MDPVILFDLDGTLLDSLADIALCGNTALEISGLPTHTLEEYRGYIGNGADMLIRRMLSPEDFEKHGAQVKNDYMTIYGDLCAQGCKPFPGIPEMLRTLRLSRWSGVPRPTVGYAIRQRLSRPPIPPASPRRMRHPHVLTVTKPAMTWKSATRAPRRATRCQAS